ncbi:AraC family transcriptional regulator [Cytophagales bacterium WSM2-2]|nr:AraC family transcriptional regulator [Cytophagales bacterium WSM2-2]
MKERIYRLPESFDDNPSSDVYFHFYVTNKPTTKNKVVFSKNLICFLQQGHKQVHTSNDSATIDEQQLLLLPSGSMLMSERMAKKSQFKSILLFFSDQFLSDFCLKHGIEPSSKTSSTGLVALSKDRFLHHFESSLELLKSLSPGNVLQSIKLEELLLYLLYQYPAKIKAFIQAIITQQPMLRLKQTVQHNIDKNLTVEEIAFLCNMSMSTFKWHFSETFLTSPKKYFTDYKMKRAKRMLISGERPSDIYEQLGYENLSAFSTEFKKHFGISPKQFQLDPIAKVFEPVA